MYVRKFICVPPPSYLDPTYYRIRLGGRIPEGPCRVLQIYYFLLFFRYLRHAYCLYSCLCDIYIYVYTHVCVCVILPLGSENSDLGVHAKKTHTSTSPVMGTCGMRVVVKVIIKRHKNYSVHSVHTAILYFPPLSPPPLSM